MIKELFDLKGKTALVTGCGQGIGRAICLVLAEHGANVIINYRSDRRKAGSTSKKVQEYDINAWLWEYDLQSETITADFSAFIGKLPYTVDILVLNASVQVRKNWNEVTSDEFDFQMNVNVRAFLKLIQCCELAMEQKGWGRILMLGSVQQSRPSRQMIVYAASKAAQLNMVKNLAWMLGDKGITINNLAPGVIGTIRNEEVLSNDVFKKKYREKNTCGLYRRT
jgi:NAD(P)-dependent dehydrogenase (short-subunit alcohol dehydrogenase family)